MKISFQCFVFVWLLISASCNSSPKDDIQHVRMKENFIKTVDLIRQNDASQLKKYFLNGEFADTINFKFRVDIAHYILKSSKTEILIDSIMLIDSTGIPNTNDFLYKYQLNFYDSTEAYNGDIIMIFYGPYIDKPVDFFAHKK